MREDCHNCAGQLALALEKQMNTVLVCLDRETRRAGELRTASCLLPTNSSVIWTGIQKGFLQSGPTTSLASKHSTTSKEQESPQNMVLAHLGLSYSCAWQGPPAALHLLISTAPQITLLCGSLSALWQINSGMLQHTTTISSWRGRQRPAESRVLHWQDSTLQG